MFFKVHIKPPNTPYICQQHNPTLHNNTKHVCQRTCSSLCRGAHWRHGCVPMCSLCMCVVKGKDQGSERAVGGPLTTSDLKTHQHATECQCKAPAAPLLVACFVPLMGLFVSLDDQITYASGLSAAWNVLDIQYRL